MTVQATRESVDYSRYPIHSLLFSRGAKVFHIAAEIEDVPGSLSSVLDLVSGQIDLQNTMSYSHGKGLASWRAFAKAVDGDTTADSLEAELRRSPFVRQVEVTEGRNGLVVNRTSAGPSLGPREPLIVLSIAGMNSVFDQVVKVLGTGGEAILHGEGFSLGQANGRYLKEYLGSEIVKHGLEELAGLYSSFGWGIVEISASENGTVVTGRVQDCFECVNREAESRCNFFMGHFKGVVSTMQGVYFNGTETRCTKRGNEFCEFELRTSRSKD